MSRFLIRFPDREAVMGFLKRNRWLLLAAGAGLLLMLLPLRDTEPQMPVIAETPEELFSLAAFEEQLADILSDVQGAGDVRVLLTLANGTETIYAADSSTTLRTDDSGSAQTSERTIALQGGTPLEQKRIYPRFSGAVVVCGGGTSATVRLMLLEAVSAVTGLSADRISILPGS